MNKVLEHVLTAAASAALMAGAGALGVKPALDSGAASREAQNQCCPIARELAQGCLRHGDSR